MYEKVILPTDGSKRAERAVEEGLDLAKAFDIPAIGVYVVDLDRYEQYKSDEVRESMNHGMKKTGERALKKVRHMAHEKDVDIQTKILMGTPYRRITDVSDQNDIIYMSSHGASGFSEMVFGSTTERVLKRAGCTVAVVPGR